MVLKSEHYWNSYYFDVLSLVEYISHNISVELNSKSHNLLQIGNMRVEFFS